MYEYKSISINHYGYSINQCGYEDEELNELGAEGWQLVAVLDIQRDSNVREFYFMRKVKGSYVGGSLGPR